MRRAARITGTVMIVAGACSIAWALLVWQWQDPFTAVYTKYEQHKLASSFAHRFAEYRPPRGGAAPSGERSGGALGAGRRIKAAATAYRRALHEGEPVGRLIVPRLGLKSIVVNGTAHDDLTKGPGRELHTYMPGEGELVYVAGHRTTYLAPFAHIDSLKPGDRITFQLPYATFVYEVTGHKIVTADDLDVLRSHHKELLVLQACHPRFFATHRYLAYAKLVRVEPRKGAAYDVGSRRPDHLERQVPHRRAGGELALAARSEHERVRLGRADDHVRLLAGDRLEHDAVVGDGRAGADEVVAAGVPLDGDGERARRPARAGVGRPLQGQHRRPDEELAADERRDRVARQAEDERPAADAERDRLARPHGDAPEDLLDPELGLDPPDEVVRADRDAARGDEHVVLEALPNRIAGARPRRPRPTRAASPRRRRPSSCAASIAPFAS